MNLRSYRGSSDLGFKREVAALFADQASRKPACVVAELVAGGILERISKAPFED
jgi:hypothetical protein